MSYYSIFKLFWGASKQDMLLTKICSCLKLYGMYNDLLNTFQSCYIYMDYQVHDYQVQDHQIHYDYQVHDYQDDNDCQNIGIDQKHNQCQYSESGKLPNERIIQFSFCKRTIDSLGYSYIYLGKFCSQYNLLAFLSDPPIENILCEKQQQFYGKAFAYRLIKMFENQFKL